MTDKNDILEVCSEMEIHTDKLEKVKKYLPDEDSLCDLAELFKVFGDSSRIRILSALSEEEICVCDLAQVQNMTQSAVSHQLNILKRSKLVKAKRDGKSVFYSLDDDHVREILSCGLEHIHEDR